MAFCLRGMLYYDEVVRGRGEGEEGLGERNFFFFYWQGSAVKEWGISRGDYIELKFLITLSAVGEEGELRVLRRMPDISIQEWIFFFFRGLYANKCFGIDFNLFQNIGKIKYNIFVTSKIVCFLYFSINFLFPEACRSFRFQIFS